MGMGGGKFPQKILFVKNDLMIVEGNLGVPKTFTAVYYSVENDKEKRGVRISKNLFDGLSTVFCHSLHVQVLSRKNATLLSI